MSNNPKKKKRNKLSSTSREDETDAKRQDGTPVRRGHKRRKDNTCYKSRTKEQRKSAKDGSRSARQIKKAVYRLPTTKLKELKAARKEEQLKNSRSAQFHGEGCSSTAGIASGVKTVEREQSKPVKTSCAASPSPTTEKTLKDKSDKRCSRSSYSELKHQRMSCKLDAATPKNRQGLEKKIGPARERLTTTYNSSNTKTQINCQHSRSSCMDAKGPPATVPVESCISSRPSTLGKSLNKWRSFTSTPESNKSPSSKTEYPPLTPKQISALKFVPFKFRIPRKVKAGPSPSSDGNNINNNVSSNQNLKLTGNSDGFGVVAKNVEPGTGKPGRVLAAPSYSPFKEQNRRSSLPDQLPPEHPPAGDANCDRSFDQGQVVEELHLARSEKRLEVDVMQSYGELTGMDIDFPEEGAAEYSREPKQKNLILVLDTNILLSHLDYVKKIRSCGLEALGHPMVLIPWVVLQELDWLKNKKGLSGSVAHLATPAISFIYNSLKKRDPHLWGQSMQQATQISNGLNTENNDDRVLQCCLQYQNMYPECALILCTNDKNLSSKALLSGVRALSKTDLEAEVRRPRHGHHFLQSIQSPILSRFVHNVSSSTLSPSCTPVRPLVQDSAHVSVATPEKDRSINTPPVKEGGYKEAEWDLSGYLWELEECLRDVLSEVLETEMKAAYDDLWLEIVYIKPPWSLQDILQCFKKHWIAVFGQVVPRKMSETVANLISFFSTGETVTTLSFLQETKEFVKVFGKSSKHVPDAVTLIENILNKLQSQHHLSAEQELSAGDVFMNDEDDLDKQAAPVRVSPQEVWSVFENIWSQVYQTSLEVFKALSFDPHTMQAATPMGRPPPPQDALACLHRLSSMVSQLLQAFSRVLSSTPGLEEVQALFSIIYSNKLVSEDARLTTKDLLDCFSQPNYREKLAVGGNQLLELKKALDGCVQTTGQNFAFTTPC